MKRLPVGSLEYSILSGDQIRRISCNHPLFVSRDHHGNRAAWFRDDTLFTKASSKVGFGADFKAQQTETI
jgi:hypothetical protein